MTPQDHENWCNIFRLPNPEAEFDKHEPMTFISRLKPWPETPQGDILDMDWDDVADSVMHNLSVMPYVQQGGIYLAVMGFGVSFQFTKEGLYGTNYVRYEPDNNPKGFSNLFSELIEGDPIVMDEPLTKNSDEMIRKVAIILDLDSMDAIVRGLSFLEDEYGKSLHGEMATFQKRVFPD